MTRYFLIFPTVTRQTLDEQGLEPASRDAVMQ